jgi:uncharacterized protein (TIGR00730 family)
MEDGSAKNPLRRNREDVEVARRIPDTPQTRAPSYRLAFMDRDFMTREELRPVRLQLELLKPQLVMDERGIESTIVMFGGARLVEHPEQAGTPKLAKLCGYYTEARRFANLMTAKSLQSYSRENVICTGGGPGVMEAGNRGAQEAGGVSIGLNIVLPHEQAPNAFVTPDLCFNFHYFAIRKMHFLMRAKAIVVFPGGFGTMDEMFESLTLIQTGRMAHVPFILFGKSYWEKVIDWTEMAECGVISPEDLNLFRYVETAEEAVDLIESWPTAG